MNYGFFDQEHREYVITRPDTPMPWANYLGSPAYGALISNNAGGYSFVQSGANGRILRYRFDDSDQPGRYIYLRDDETEDYWSASWQPVGKPLDQYKSECRHGLGYSILSAEYAGICSEVAYYVPEEMGQGSAGRSMPHAKDPACHTYEIWYLKVRNASDRVRKLTVTGFAELTNHGNYEQDLVNLQYSRFISSTSLRGDHILQRIHGNLADEEGSGHQVEERFFGLSGQKIASACGDKEHFLGKYHSYGDPQAVADGDLGNVFNYNEYSCGALSAKLELAPGETASMAFILGAMPERNVGKVMARYEDPDSVCPEEIDQLRSLWDERLQALKIKTPDEDFNTMVGTWNAYNCYMTFLWSRAASFIYCGLRNGYGYRDTVQDIQGIIHLSPQMAKEKIIFMLSAQVDNGGGLPLVKFTHTPGQEDTPDDASYVQSTGHPAYRADDALWLFPTIWKYVAETGDTGFLEEVIPFANNGEGTVYEHLQRAVDFSLNHLGPHKMPAGLYADWNDCLRLGKNGESVFVAFQFYLAMDLLGTFAAFKGDGPYQTFLNEKKEELREIIERECWDEDRYIRGFTEDGKVIGGREDPEANIWLNPQSWSVISRAAKKERAGKALATAYERLNTRYGAALMDPPYHAHAFDGALAVIFNAGVKENAGIFSQPQGWAILSQALMGNGDLAWQYYHENCPAAQNDEAQIRRLEPYCYGQFTEGPASEHFGRSHVHWLTGTASTVMVGIVEGILGLRPDLKGLWLMPAIPHDWDGFEMEKTFRGRKLHIVVKNPSHRQSGCESITLNGEMLEKPYLPENKLLAENEILLVL